MQFVKKGKVILVSEAESDESASFSIFGSRNPNFRGLKTLHANLNLENLTSKVCKNFIKNKAQ